MKHNAVGFCSKCQELFDVFPGFHPGLRAWFEKVQLAHADFHISEAGRGKFKQELYFQRGASKAHYGKSSHNFNCGLDTFQLKDGNAFWNPGYYAVIIKPFLNEDICWYGSPGAEFSELPHFEWKNWRQLVASGESKLVEPL